MMREQLYNVYKYFSFDIYSPGAMIKAGEEYIYIIYSLRAESLFFNYQVVSQPMGGF